MNALSILDAKKTKIRTFRISDEINDLFERGAYLLGITAVSYFEFLILHSEISIINNPILLRFLSGAKVNIVYKKPERHTKTSKSKHSAKNTSQIPIWPTEIKEK